MIYFDKHFFHTKIFSTETIDYYYDLVNSVRYSYLEYTCPKCGNNAWTINKRDRKLFCTKCLRTKKLGKEEYKNVYIRRGDYVEYIQNLQKKRAVKVANT